MLEYNSQAEEVFSEAWQQVLAGRSIESVLADYPEYTAELEPMLRIVTRVRVMPPPSLSPDALSRIRLRTQGALASGGEGRYVLAPKAHGLAVPNEPLPRSQAPELDALAAQHRTQRRRSWLALFSSPLQLSIGSVLLLVIATMITTAVALLVFTAVRPGSDADAPSPVVVYSGTITRIEGTIWHIGQNDDEQVLIDDATVIHGQPVVGATMRCIAVRVDGNKMQAIEVWVLAGPAAHGSSPGD